MKSTRRKAVLSRGSIANSPPVIKPSFSLLVSRQATVGTSEEQEDDEDKDEDPEELAKQRAMDDWKDGLFSAR